MGTRSTPFSGIYARQTHLAVQRTGNFWPEVPHLLSKVPMLVMNLNEFQRSIESDLKNFAKFPKTKKKSSIFSVN